jgi:hypothetical protein
VLEVVATVVVLDVVVFGADGGTITSPSGLGGAGGRGGPLVLVGTEAVVLLVVGS